MKTAFAMILLVAVALSTGCATMPTSEGVAGIVKAAAPDRAGRIDQITEILVGKRPNPVEGFQRVELQGRGNQPQRPEAVRRLRARLRRCRVDAGTGRPGAAGRRRHERRRAARRNRGDSQCGRCRVTARPATVKLTRDEWTGLIMAVVAQVGIAPARSAVEAAIGPDRAAALLDRKEATQISKADTIKLVRAWWPIIPGGDREAKIQWLLATGRQVFVDDDRFAEVVGYVRHRVEEHETANGEFDPTAPIAPPPAPAPEPPGPMQYADEIPLSGVKFVGHDIRDWPAVYDLDVSVAGGKVTMRQALTKELPGKDALGNGTPLSGNAWVIANVGGGWHAATWEWFKVGQTVKNAKAVAGDHVKKAPFPALWRPARGETIYLAVSGLARNRHRNGKVRTPFKKVVWP